MTLDQIQQAQSDLSHQVAADAKRNGDKLMIHLLAAAEEAGAMGEHAVAGHLLHLAGFHQAGRLKHVCEALGAETARYHRVLNGDAAVRGVLMALGIWWTFL